MQQEVMAALAGSVAFDIPADATNDELYASHIIDQDVNIISFFPHMHTRGKDMELIAHYPNGETQSLINIPKYNFDWQLFYYTQTPVALPTGSNFSVALPMGNNPLPTASTSRKTGKARGTSRCRGISWSSRPRTSRGTSTSTLSI